MDHGFESGHGLRYKYDKDPDGRGRVRISHTTLPCPGVALRCYAVIDCTPSEERMPPVTIDILNKNLPPPGEVSPQSGSAAPPAAEAPQAAARFTCSSGDFVVSSQLRWVEEAVAAAGLPPECARSVNEFCHLSAASASNTFYTSVAITVEADVPGNVDVDEDEDEVVPDGAATGECAICHKVYVVGGATSVKLPCSHVYHENCLDRWTRVNATCPYCRAPLPDEDCFWDDEQEDDGDDISGDSGDPDNFWDEDEDVDTSGDEDYRSQPSWTWALIGGAARFALGFVSNLARRLVRVFLNCCC